MNNHVHSAKIMLFSAIGIVLLLCLCMLVSCGSPKYVPVERVQKEYIDRLLQVAGFDIYT